MLPAVVSAVIPARNEEASIARAVESVAAQPEITEVIVVNDQSTDRTGAILTELVGRIPKLRVLEIVELPAGWVGKNYAAWMGAQAATGEWLLFTDADTVHLPGAMRRALSDAAEQDAALVSYSPEQEMETFWERALIPFVYTRLAARFSYVCVNDPRHPDAAANGQFLLVRHDAYRAVGGHRAVAGEILEDVALARLLKQQGCKIYFTAPRGVVRTRMYRSFRAMWEGWTKNLYPLVGANFRSLSWECAEAFPLFEACALLGALYVFREMRGALLLPGLCLLGGLIAYAHLRYAAALYRNLYPLACIQYYFVGACLYEVALVVSWWKNTRGSVAWKGRTYAARTP